MFLQLELTLFILMLWVIIITNNLFIYLVLILKTDDK
jgi:hypothetical protein